MSEEKEETVSKKVLVGDSKYREYRLPKSLVTDRSSLWRRKCEIGKRVSEILKCKNAKINEYHAKIKQLEKTRDSWKTVAKSVTDDNESFFLDALLASEKDIELFEKENFLASNSWSKLRKIVDLTEGERQELGVNSVEPSVTTDNKPDHYRWVLQKTDAPQSEPIFANQIDSVNSVTSVPVSATISEDLDLTVDATIDALHLVEEVSLTLKDDPIQAAETLEVLTARTKTEESPPGCEKSTSANCSSTTVQDNSPMTEDLSKTTTLNNGTGPCNGTVKIVTDNANSAKDNATEMKDTEIQKSTVVNEVTQSTKESIPPAEEKKSPSTFIDINNVSQDKTNGVTSTSLKHDNDSLESPKKDSAEFDDTPRKTALETADLKADNVRNTKETTENINVDTEKVENTNGVTDSEKEDTGSKTEKKQEKALEALKHKITFPSGYPRLRLTSERSSVEEIDPPPQKVANVWQLRAAERAEKIKAAKECLPSNGSTVVSPAPTPSFISKPFPWVKPQPAFMKKESPVKQDRAKPVNPQNVEVTSQPLQNNYVAKEPNQPVKKTEDDGWTTFSSKKGKRNSTDENFKTTKVIDVPKNGVGNSAPSPATTSKVEKLGRKDVKPTPETLELSSTDPKILVDNEVPTKNSELIEKRTLRRQRVQNKIKEKAKQAKEQEKMLKEQRRLELEKQIEEKRRKKKEEDDKKFLKKKQEMEAIRKTREDAERLKLKNCDEGFKQMLDVKNRMNEYLKSKQIPYRMIATNCYIAARVKELEKENMDLEINATKMKTLLEYKAQMKNLEMKNKHMMFISLQMQEKSKEFKLDDLLAYVHYDHYQIPIEHTSPYQLKVRMAYDQYCQEHKCDISENMVKAIQFAENLINKMSAMENQTVPYENALVMLKEYKELHHNIFDFLGIATYLRTRMETPFFVLEEDYLLNIQHFEDDLPDRRKNENKQAVAGKKKPEKKSEQNSQETVESNGVNGGEGHGESVDDEEEEMPECKDGFCQTEENYDVRAASFLPELPAEPVQ